jgi:hypothetical protein
MLTLHPLDDGVGDARSSRVAQINQHSFEFEKGM